MQPEHVRVKPATDLFPPHVLQLVDQPIFHVPGAQYLKHLPLPAWLEPFLKGAFLVHQPHKVTDLKPPLEVTLHLLAHAAVEALPQVL